MPSPKKAMPDKERWRRFVEAYMGKCAGNATQAAIAAGYSQKSAYQRGSELVRNPQVKALIAARVKASPDVMQREELQAFWTKVAKNPAEPTTTRLKASELLGKSHGAFIDKLQHSGRVGLGDVLKPDPIDE